MAYHKAATATVVPIRRAIVGEAMPQVPARAPLQGLGSIVISTPIGKATIDTASIANSIVNEVWPNVQGKIDGMVPGIVDKAIVRVQEKMPDMINSAMPIIEKKAAQIAGQYETRFLSMAQPYAGIGKGAVVAAVAIGALVTVASLITLKNATRR